MSHLPELTELNGRPAVTSRQIAEDFDKSHKHVIRDIEDLQVSDNFRKPNFGLSEYTVQGQTRKYKQYLMTRDGFTMLVMGFTGRKATAFKEAYIEAFNRMESALLDQVRPVLSSKQRNQLAEAINQSVSGLDMGTGATMWAANRLRVRFSLKRLEDMTPEQLPFALAELLRLQDDLQAYFIARAEINEFVLRDIVGAGTPWTPSTGRFWVQRVKATLPAKPDWVRMQGRIEQVQ